MIPYLICFIPVAGIYLFSRDRFENNRHAIFWMLLPFFLLVAFRSSSVGSDTIAYNKMYTSMSWGQFGLESSYDRLEIGYKILLFIFTKISSNPQFQYICLAIFFEIAFTSFLSKNAENPAHFIVLFGGLNLFSFYITGVRQSIAITICLLSYEKVKKKQFIRFLIIVLIAFSFHKSAIFFLLTYFFANRKLQRNHIPLYLAGFTLIAFFNEWLFSIGGEVFDLAYGIENVGNGYFMFSIVALVTIMSFIAMEKLIAHNVNNIYLIQINVITMAMWVLRLFSRTAERPSLFFMPFTFLLIDQIMEVIDDMRVQQVVKLFSTVFLGVYFIYRLKGVGLIPYTFFWQ